MTKAFFEPGIYRSLGCVPSPREHLLRARRIGEIIQPEVCSWRSEVDFRHLLWNRHDQDGVGQCCPTAAVQALEAIREFQGLARVKLSAGCLYGQVVGDKDEGATLFDVMTAAGKSGTCPQDLVPELDWHVTTWPSNWREIAASYRQLELWNCPTACHIAAAVAHYTPCVIGIAIGANYNPDSEGFIPDRVGRIVGYHAQVVCGRLFRNNRHWFILRNSWQDWSEALDGFAYLPESYLAGEMLDAWAPRCVTFSKEK